MPVVQFRGLATKGILHDPSDFALDLQSWSGGSNVRFHANKAERAPVFKTYSENLTFPPYFAAARRPSTGVDAVFTLSDTGRLSYTAANVVFDVTPSYSLFPSIATEGAGYIESAPPAVTISAPAYAYGTGRTAVASCTVNAGGAIEDVVLIDQGAGYTAADMVSMTFAAPPSSATNPITALGKIVYAPVKPSLGTQAATSSFLGDVLYVNRPDFCPVWYGPVSGAFQTLPGWDQSWSCRSLRSYSDYMLALNVTKGTNSYPNMVKWSNVAFDGSPPDSWDADDLTTTAGENPLDELQSPLVDGLSLRSAFILYSENEVWEMLATGGQEIFSFSKLFGNGGLIAPNCVVEVDGIHYCFGPTDLYRHDGTTKLSIIDGQNRDYVFQRIALTSSEKCFVTYLPRLKQVMFCYVDNTTETDVAYPGTTYCNRAAVYDVSSSTWSFVDLPNITAGFQANISGNISYASTVVDVSYGAYAGSYQSVQGYADETTLFSAVQTATVATVGVDYSSTFAASQSYAIIAQTYSAAETVAGTDVTYGRLYAYDFANKGLQPLLPIAADANPPALLERTGIDLDQEGSDLTTYKTIRRIFPLMNAAASTPCQVEIGSSLVQDGPVTWSAPMSFDPTTQYKLDIRKGGRYLGIRITVPTTVDFTVTGFDFDITSAGRR